MLNEIIDEIALIQNSEYRAQVYLAIAEQFNKNAEPEQALSHIDQAIKELSQLPTYESAFWEYEVAKQLSKSGQQERSEELLNRLFDWAMAMPEDYGEEQDIELGRISDTYAEIGLYDQAIQVAQEIFDELDYAQALVDISRAAIRDSKYEQVPHVISATPSEWQRYYVLNQIAATYAYCHQPEKALALVQQIVSPFEKISALVGVFMPLSRHKTGISQWLALLQEVEAFAIAETNPSVKAQALRIMAQQHGRLNQFEQARGLLDQAQEIAEIINPDEKGSLLSRNAVLKDIADAISQLEQCLAKQPAKPNRELMLEKLQEIRATADDSVRNNDQIADLEQVLRAQMFAEQGRTDETLAAAEHIGDAPLKELAQRLAGVKSGGHLDDVVDDYKQVCRQTTQQSNSELGIAMLQQVLNQMTALNGCRARHTGDELISYRSAYKADLLVAIVEAYFQLRSAV